MKRIQMSPEYNVSKIRQQFPMLKQTMHGKPLVYLDSAATTQKPSCVIEALQWFYGQQYATVHRSVYEFASRATSRYQLVRQKVKEFIGASFIEEIIFTKGTTEGINLVASSFGRKFLRPGDEILLSEMEHHSNIVPWQIVARENGLKIQYIPINDRAELNMEAFDTLLTERTKIVSVAHLANATGTINPIKEIIEKAHGKGAKVLIDGAQGIAHLPVDVQELGADFYAFSAHKAYGPMGVGVLYGKKALLEKMPPYQGGGDMIEEVSLDGFIPQHPPMKFEAGTPSVGDIMGLGEALSFINSIGKERIASWEQGLLEYATGRIGEVKEVKVIGTSPNKGGIISFVVEGMHPLDVATLLDIRGIAVRTGHLCAQPTLRRFSLTSMIRISFGLYTTFEEIDRFIDSLKEVILLLRPSMSY